MELVDKQTLNPKMHKPKARTPLSPKPNSLSPKPWRRLKLFFLAASFSALTRGLTGAVSAMMECANSGRTSTSKGCLLLRTHGSEGRASRGDHAAQADLCASTAGAGDTAALAAPGCPQPSDLAASTLGATVRCLVASRGGWARVGYPVSCRSRGNNRLHQQPRDRPKGRNARSARSRPPTCCLASTNCTYASSGLVELPEQDGLWMGTPISRLDGAAYNVLHVLPW